MLRLPILVAAGGINSAGRTSNRRAFRRMVIDALDAGAAAETRAALAALMGTEDAEQQDAGTLVRGIENSHFDPAAVPWARRIVADTAVDAEMPPTQMTEGLPQAWSPRPGSGKRTAISLEAGSELLVPGTREFEVSAAGLLPTGFDPGTLYPVTQPPPRPADDGVCRF